MQDINAVNRKIVCTFGTPSEACEVAIHQLLLCFDLVREDLLFWRGCAVCNCEFNLGKHILDLSREELVLNPLGTSPYD